MTKKKESNCTDLIPEIANDIKWIKEIHTKELSGINNHLKELNGSIGLNSIRSVEAIARTEGNEKSLSKIWKIALAMIGIGGTVIIVLLECYLKKMG